MNIESVFLSLLLCALLLTFGACSTTKEAYPLQDEPATGGTKEEGIAVKREFVTVVELGDDEIIADSTRGECYHIICENPQQFSRGDLVSIGYTAKQALPDDSYIIKAEYVYPATNSIDMLWS